MMLYAPPTLMREFNVPSSTVQWLTTGFMLTNGIMIPVTAFLIETFTTRQLFLYAMGMVIAFAPALGPTISGLLVEWLSWRWMFALLVAIAGGVIAAACFTVHNVGEPTHPHIDVLSVVLSTFGFGGVLFGLSTAGGNGWGSMDVLVSLAIGVIALTLFIWRQMRLEQPMLDFRIFRMVAIVCIICLVAPFFIRDRGLHPGQKRRKHAPGPPAHTDGPSPPPKKQRLQLRTAASRKPHQSRACSIS